MSPATAVKTVERTLTVETAFVMDCTGSMYEWIDTCKEKLQEIAEALRKACKEEQGFARTVIKFGFVGYRDFEDLEHFEVKDFTEDVKELESFIAGVKAKGGGDEAEDVLGGLEKVQNGLTWTVKGKWIARRIIHFADAPGHGRLYNGGVKDNHADVDADGSMGKELMGKFARRKFDFTFVEISTKTRQMTERFEKAYNDGNPSLAFHHLQLNSPTDEFARHIADTILTSVHSVTK